MSDLIFKIEKTLDVVVPFVVLVLSALQLTGVINIVDKAVPIIYGLLALVEAVFKIWGITLRRMQFVPAKKTCPECEIKG
jgi:hypothetical protein